MDSKQIIDYATQSGFLKEMVEKVWRLTEILEVFGGDDVLKEELALRGGTQLNLVTFDDMPRLSLDIDVDFCSDVGREEMISQREKIDDLIKRHLQGLGYTLSEDSRYSHSLSGYRWRYQTISGGVDMLKIEINYSMRIHALPLEQLPIKFSPLNRRVQVLSMAPIEVMACKIAALLERGAARDLFDVNQLVVSGMFASQPERDLLRKLTIFYQAIELPRPVTVEAVTTTEKINELSQDDYRRNLLPVMRHGGNEQPFNVLEAQTRVKEYLTELLELSVGEKEFVEALAAKQYRPDLLFEARIAERIKNHPMAVWKCR